MSENNKSCNTKKNSVKNIQLNCYFFLKQKSIIIIFLNFNIKVIKNYLFFQENRIISIKFTKLKNKTIRIIKYSSFSPLFFPLNSEN